LTGNALSKAYAGSDVFFFPSDTETFGNVTLEAMASGLPCLVADAQGSKSLVDHNENGFLIPVSKKKKFISRAEELVKDAELRRRLGQKSFEKAQNYTWDKINSTLLTHYYEVLGNE